MDKNSVQDSISINTLIGPHTFVKGNLYIAGFIRIDGDIEGAIETKGRIIIGENARIKGNIRALTAIIGGIVQGDIITPEGVTVLSTGLVIGTIITKKINIEEMVLFSGNCFAINDDAMFQKQVTTYNNQKAYQENVAFHERR